MSLVSEFKAFIMRGNVVDLAVGVVIGAAFGKVVESIVKDVFMPIVGVLTGGIDFSKRTIPLTDDAAIGVGNVVQSLINFVIIGACLFLVVKLMNTMNKKPAALPTEPTTSEKLLAEIRDSLKNR